MRKQRVSHRAQAALDSAQSHEKWCLRFALIILLVAAIFGDQIPEEANAQPEDPSLPRVVKRHFHTQPTLVRAIAD